MLFRILLAIVVTLIGSLPAAADPAAAPRLAKHYNTHGGPIIQVAIHPKGTQVAFGTTAGMMHVRDLTDGGNDSNLADAAGWCDYSPIVTAANPNGTPLGTPSLVSLSPTGRLSIWYTDTFQRQSYSNDVGNMGALSANGRVLAVTKGGLDMWIVPLNHYDPSWHQIIMPRPDGVDGRVTTMALDQNGALMASGYLQADGSGKVVFWDRLTGKVLNSHKLPQAPGTVAYSPLRDGPLALVGRSADGKGFISLWHPRGDAQLATLPASPSPVLSAAFSWDAKYIAAGRFDGTIDIWDVQAQKVVSTVSGAHQGPVRAVGWGRDGKRLISGGEDGLVKVWEL